VEGGGQDIKENGFEENRVHEEMNNVVVHAVTMYDESGQNLQKNKKWSEDEIERYKRGKLCAEK